MLSCLHTLLLIFMLILLYLASQVSVKTFPVWVKATICFSDFFYVTFRFKCQEFSVHSEISIIKKIMRHLLPFLIFFRKQEEKLSDHPDLGTNNNVPVFPHNQGNLLKGTQYPTFVELTDRKRTTQILRAKTLRVLRQS